MATLMDLRNATLSARQRTGDHAISTRVDKGRIQVVRVFYPAGKPDQSVVEPVTGFITLADAVRALNAL
jgi:hypothetical protein